MERIRIGVFPEEDEGTEWRNEPVRWPSIPDDLLSLSPLLECLGQEREIESSERFLQDVLHNTRDRVLVFDPFVVGGKSLAARIFASEEFVGHGSLMKPEPWSNRPVCASPRTMGS